MAKVLLGIDLGTTSIKMIAVDSVSGQTLAKCGVTYPTNRPHQGWAEQNPADWLAAVTQIWQELSQLITAHELIGIGICSQVNTHLLVDAQSNPLTQAITWKDLRCADIAHRMDSAITAERRLQLWGGPFTIDSSFSLTRLQWWRENEPASYAKATAVLLPKDFLIFKLTGELVADPLSAIGIVGSDGKYLSDVLAMVDGANSLCAPLRDFDQVAGVTNGALGFPKNIPVAVGTMDAWGNVYGSGLVDTSHAMEIGGTSEIVGVMSQVSIPTAGIISFPAIRSRYLHAGPTQAGGDALLWFANMHSRTIQDCLSESEKVSGSSSRVIFLPHLDGERAPYWNPKAQGVWLGMNRETNFGDLAQSVLEGVAFSARSILDRCQSAAAGKVDFIRISGGAGKSQYWNQIKADVHGRPVQVLAELDTGARGIALIAGGAIGLTENLEEWANSLVLVAQTLEPNPIRVRELSQRYEIYLESYQALVGIFEKNVVTK